MKYENLLGKDALSVSEIKKCDEAFETCTYDQLMQIAELVLLSRKVALDSDIGRREALDELTMELEDAELKQSELEDQVYTLQRREKQLEEQLEDEKKTISRLTKQCAESASRGHLL